jgi:uncharacterized protein (TIGR00369 family)
MADLPPYAELLGLRVERGSGESLIVMPFSEDVVGRPGYLHGGAIAGLLEFAAFWALADALGAGKASGKPIAVTVDYMRSGTSQPTYAAATVQRIGQRIANVEAFAWQASRDKPIASGRINYLLDRSDQ